MLLKVGELAKRSGLTVRCAAPLRRYWTAQTFRTLRYRLYDRGDIARLHQVQALRALGAALELVAHRLCRHRSVDPAEDPVGR